MPAYTSTATVETPRDHAWAILSDVRNWPVWLLTMSTVEPLDSGPLAPIMGRLFGGIIQRYIDREAAALAQTARERWLAATQPVAAG